MRLLRTKLSLATAVILSLAFTPLAAQDFQKGLAAAQAGDYAIALQEWMPLAEAGDAVAQRNIGVMYDNGTGVPQDNIMVHIWFNVSSANGFSMAVENKDKLAASMTTEDISKAQSMARECMNSGYTECGYWSKDTIFLQETKAVQEWGVILISN